MLSAEAAAMAIINRRNMTADIARVNEKKKGCHRGDEWQPLASHWRPCLPALGGIGDGEPVAPL
jgi:hypothetical protein